MKQQIRKWLVELLLRATILKIRMIRRYSQIFVYLLLVFLPIQALAHANMLACNRMMQASKMESAEAVMPCHQEALSMQSEHQDQTKSTNLSSCSSLCASMCALTTMPLSSQLTLSIETTQAIEYQHLSYTSVPLSSLHRPPIAFI
jgi:hypothetical protein